MSHPSYLPTPTDHDAVAVRHTRAPAPAAELNWHGKGYADLKPAERADLADRDPELFERMRKAHTAPAPDPDAAQSRADALQYVALKPAARAELAKSDPTTFRRLRSAAKREGVI